MAHLLYIDTSDAPGTIAIARDEDIIAQAHSTESRDHASVINRLIEETCREAGIRLQDLDAVVVCGGPGSYTGLRIGVATAKGLCYALGIPLILHNRLSIMAWQQIRQGGLLTEKVLSLLRAREKEYFLSIYDTNFTCLLEPRHVDEIQTLEIIKFNQESLSVVSTSEVEGQLFDIAQPHVFLPFKEIDVRNWAVLGYKDYQSGHCANLAHAEPFYLKGVFINK